MLLDVWVFPPLLSSFLGSCSIVCPLPKVSPLIKYSVPPEVLMEYVTVIRAF